LIICLEKNLNDVNSLAKLQNSKGILQTDWDNKFLKSIRD